MGCYVSTPIESNESKRYMFTGEEPELEVNDEQIIKIWWKKMGEEHFRYGLEETKVVMINNFVGNLNPKRASKRVCHVESKRIPIPVSKPFNPNGFHFLKVKEAEVMYVFRENELRPFESFDTIWESDHLVVINVNPFGAGHSLLVPFAKKQHPQFLIKEGLKVALQVLDTMGPCLRLLFNSIGGFASVNHLHFHIYFTQSPEPVELIELTPTSVKSISTFNDWTRGFCVESTDLEEAVRLIMLLVNTMQGMDIGHNIFFRKGKAWIYPRVNELSGFDHSCVGIASTELSGHMILKTEEHLKLTSLELKNLILEQSLPMEKIDNILKEAFTNSSPIE